MNWLLVYTAIAWGIRLVMVPVVLRRELAPGASLAWLGVVFLHPYIENFSATGVFLCPSWTKRSDYNPAGSNPLATLYAGSYGMNSWLWIQMLIDGRIRADGTGTYGNIRMGQVDNPSAQIWLAEHWGVSADVASEAIETKLTEAEEKKLTDLNEMNFDDL